MQSRDRWECGEGTGVESTDRVWRFAGIEDARQEGNDQAKINQARRGSRDATLRATINSTGRRAGKLFWAISRQPEMRWEKSGGGDGDTEGRADEARGETSRSNGR